MRWAFRSYDERAVERLRAAGYDTVLARLLAARGLDDPEAARAFLSPSLAQLHSPYLMAGMRAAVERVEAAIVRREKVLIYGDYDVDGTTAVVLLKTAIELCGGTAVFHVPHRIREGYGMREEVIERAAAEGVRLIISVDTGIRAFGAAEAAARLGVDLIVTDHHLPEEATGLPRALAVLNPNQPGCEYPSKALCGAGVAFKLAQALLESRHAKSGRAGRPDELLLSFLKIVAIATIADAVPLVGENRVIARLGLEGLRAPVNPGLKALVETAALEPGRRLTAGDVAFRLAPRLNAAGRMDVAQDVIELFTTRDAERARQIAERLNQLNSERQQEEKRIVEEIEAALAERPELRQAYCVVVDGEGWHRGVIGICATRVVERTGRPALVIARDETGEAHGSGRSIPAFHLLQALESCHQLLTRYGGHAHAVGFALPGERVPELRAALAGYARARLTPADFEPVVALDGELALEQITPELFHQVRRLEPFGVGNPEPVFAARGVRLLGAPRVIKERHVKLRLGPAERPDFRSSFDAMGWRMAERFQKEPLVAGELLDVAFRLEMNAHPEFGGLELTVADVARSPAR